MPRPRLILLLTAISALPALTAGENGGQPPPPRGPSPEVLFAHFDGDHNGTLSKEEFAAGLAELAKHNPPPPPRDGDGPRPPRPQGDGDGPRPPRPHGDGDGPRPPRPHGDGPRPDGQRPPPHEAGDRKSAIDAAFAAGDADGNGVLDKAEFAKALQAMPKPPRPPGDRPQGKPAEGKPAE